ncbi:hypothetical protein RMSM_04909 [Rhodopirellula maiorica SM1]|uniref:Uncharacterized protein n=1 Tax=Rhodopirellula maiorica SM1 TaxID=1265738 RepID=M5RW29_9BACT|nr:hypothetical protein [Rhodopirellula maiorica]EMI18159.1 hypothetical protein RMSM_04909 [Rhodopirellula maiorica SM1]
MDSNKIKELAIKHVEKVILAIFAIVSAFLVYQATQLPEFTQEPTRLRDDATRVKNEVDDDHTDAIIPDREALAIDIVERTKRTIKPVDIKIGYTQVGTWKEVQRNDSFKRRDPELFAPLKLQMKSVIGTMAIRSKDGEYSLANLEPADPIVVEEKKERPSRRSSRRGRGMAGDEGMYGDEMMGMEDEMSGMMGMEMSGMMGMEGSMAGAAVRRLDPENKKSLYSVPATLTEFKSGGAMKPKPMVVRFIAGTAALPHKAIYESFSRSLKDSANYRPEDRDTPKYWNFQVQRADVTDKSVDQLAEGDWVDRKDRKFHTTIAAVLWAGTAPELVPVDYRDDLLTMWIPPMLMEDYSGFVLHPMIPMLTKAELETLNAPVVDVDDPMKRLEGDNIFEGIDIKRTDVNLNETGREGMMMDSGYQMNSPYGFAGVEENPSNYKLIRFYDFEYSFDKGPRPQPGRKYVYRVRVSVKDPNFPDNPLLQPAAKTLHPEAYERVSELQAKAEKDYAPERAKGTRRSISEFRQFERWTPWSEPSEPVSLPTENTVLAGPVVPPSVKNLNFKNRSVPYAKNEPTAKMVVSKFDFSLATRVPMQIDATEGSVLSKTAESTDVIDPLTLEIKKLPDAAINNRSTVIAIDGGNPLSIVTDDDLKEPGSILIFKDNGELDVASEVDDLQPYRIYSFADEKGE